MSYKKRLERYIVDNKLVILHPYDLICSFSAGKSEDGDIFGGDTAYLYYPKGKKFVLVIRSGIFSSVESVQGLTESEGLKLLREHIEGIEEEGYFRYFGEPEEL